MRRRIIFWRKENIDNKQNNIKWAFQYTERWKALTTKEENEQQNHYKVFRWKRKTLTSSNCKWYRYRCSPNTSHLASGGICFRTYRWFPPEQSVKRLKILRRSVHSKRKQISYRHLDIIQSELCVRACIYWRVVWPWRSVISLNI